MSLIDAASYGFCYPGASEWALRELNLSLDAGEWLVVTGPSGSGKSSLARALNGVVPHFYGGSVAGHLRVCHLDPAETPMSRLFRHIGALFQDPGIQVFNASVEREIAFGLESLNLPAPEVRIRLRQSVERLGIEHLVHRVPQSLSGGEQMLVLLAAFLALAPELLVLDEPLAMLDAHAQRLVLAALHAVRDTGAGICVLEHALDAYADADMFAVMRDGSIVTRGTPGDITARLLRDPIADINPPAVARWWHTRIAPSGHAPAAASTPPLSVSEASRRLRHVPGAAIRPAADLVGHGWSEARTASVWRGHVLTQGAPAVEWSHVTYAYPPARVWLGGSGADRQPRQALSDITAAIQPGELVAIVGSNGAGKSTLLRTLNGLVRPSSGVVRIGDQMVARQPVAAMARIVAYAPQRPERIFFRATVREDMLAGPRALGTVRETEQWRAFLVDALGLAAFLDRSPYALSAGQQRLAGIAATLAAQPQIVALDEPTAGLDAGYRERLAQLLVHLVTLGVTVIIVTHDTEFARMAHRWLALRSGRLIADGPPDRLLGDAALLDQAGIRPSATFLLDCLLAERHNPAHANYHAEDGLRYGQEGVE